ncbi:hypothetical protein FOL47_008561 [Perkinsus chesapeaki]|uniref:Uncharacterized protein n=1 Tax=Perkinsus chesapeaki TaxID=330153 RepID=A0A7J6LDA7_PERCH|nr:hypothetical protein FOL47_008561 [Perkinsus chesapeaki]
MSTAAFVTAVLPLVNVLAAPWYGPQGFQCVDPHISYGAPKVVLHFEETSFQYNKTLAEGNVNMYGVSEDGGPTDEVVFTTKSQGSVITFNYESCYISLGLQTFCSKNGLKVTMGVNTDSFAHVMRTLNVVRDGNDPATVEFALVGVEYPFPILAVKNYGTNLEKLLSYMDSKTESSKEYFWMKGNALTYDILRNSLTLHQDSTPSNDIVLESC